MMIDLSIVIVNWNTRDLLARCLESVCAEERTGLEVLVVDNSSADGSAEMVSGRFAWATLIANSDNRGFARATNQGIRRSQGRYVLLLNSDTEVYPGALDSLTRFLDEHDRAAGCGPRLLNPDGSLQPSCHPMLTPGRELWRLLFLDRLCRRATYPQERWGPDTPRPVEVIKGACFLLRRAALEQVGLLDETYFMYSEEMDLCYRLRKAGWQLWWVPQAAVLHRGEASSSQMAEAMYVQLYRSKVQFHRKFGGGWRAGCFKSAVQVAYWPRLAVAVAGGLVSPALSARAHTYRRLLAELPRM